MLLFLSAALPLADFPALVAAGRPVLEEAETGMVGCGVIYELVTKLVMGEQQVVLNIDTGSVYLLCRKLSPGIPSCRDRFVV